MASEPRTPAGAPIVGSNLVRDYCAICGEPIRVCKVNVGLANACSDCVPSQTKKKRLDPVSASNKRYHGEGGLVRDEL